MDYDGTSKLGDAIAALYNCSPRSRNKLAELVKEAKAGLGFTSKAKHLPDDVRLAIYRWHYERLNPIQDVKQDSPDSTIQDVKHVHFAVTITHQCQPKRTTVMLEGYWVKALQRKHGITDNAAIRAWIEQAIKGDGVRFDSFAPLTRQVKRIIIESLG